MLRGIKHTSLIACRNFVPSSLLARTARGSTVTASSMDIVVDQPKLPVVGGGSFPVRRIFGVGKNYAKHALEMKADPKDIVFFLKPNDSLVPGSDSTIPYPQATSNLHHEIELVVAIGAAGRNVTPEAALGLVYGYAVGIDLTRRDIQNEARTKSNPWDLSKSFENSAPISPLVKAAEVKANPLDAQIWFKVNGKERQSARTSEMTWNVDVIISQLSTFVELKPGDLIMTGTPEGVGALVTGDVAEGGVEGVGEIKLTIA